MKTFRWVVLGLSTLVVSSLIGNTAFGRTGGMLSNALPVGVIFPTPVGICFPGIPIAAGVNAAALAANKKENAFQLAGSPPLQSGDPTSYLAAFGTNTQRIGWGIGYAGSSTSSGQVHGLYSGVGFKLGDAFSLGMGTRDSDLSGGFDPSVDLGAHYRSANGIVGSIVGYNLESSMQVAVGLGYGRARKDNVEINVLTPSLIAGGSATDYAVTLAASVYSGPFGTSYRTTFYVSSRTFTHTLGALVWLMPSMNFSLQLTSPRTFMGGITYAF